MSEAKIEKFGQSVICLLSRGSSFVNLYLCEQNECFECFICLSVMYYIVIL